MPILPECETTAQPGQAVHFPDALPGHDAQNIWHLLCVHLSGRHSKHILCRWQFVEEIYDLAPEVLERLIGKRKLPFLLTLAGTDSLLKKYLNAHEASLCRDINGNTLLHVAILRAVFTDIENACNQGTSCRKYYDYLVARGGNPDKKNKKGVSCNDIFVIIRKKLQQLTEVINENSK